MEIDLPVHGIIFGIFASKILHVCKATKVKENLVV
jgi:hypothetical protein